MVLAENGDVWSGWAGGCAIAWLPDCILIERELAMTSSEGPKQETPTDADYMRLGKIVTLADNIDTQVSILYAGVAGINLTVAFATFSPLMSQKPKHAAISNLAYNFLHSDDQKGEKHELFLKIKGFVDRIKSFDADRNKIVHGHWSFEGPKPIRFYAGPSFEDLDYATRPRENSQKAASKQDKFTYDRDRIESVILDGIALNRDLQEFLKTTFPALFQGPRQPPKSQA